MLCGARVSGNEVFSAHVSGGAKAQVGGTADAVISLPEMQGAVYDAHVRQAGGRARECSADGWGCVNNSVLETV